MSDKLLRKWKANQGNARHAGGTRPGEEAGRVNRLLTLAEVAEQLGLSATPRAVYSLPIPRSVLSPRRTRWAEEDVEEYARECRQAWRARERSARPSALTTVRIAASEPSLAEVFWRHGVVPKSRPIKRPRR